MKNLCLFILVLLMGNGIVLAQESMKKNTRPNNTTIYKEKRPREGDTLIKKTVTSMYKNVPPRDTLVTVPNRRENDKRQIYTNKK